MEHGDFAIEKTNFTRHLLILLLALAVLYATSCYNFLLFHSLAESFCIVVACCISMLLWNARRLLDDTFLKIIARTYMFVACLDLLHMLAYRGMGVFEESGADLPTQLWIAARYLESVSLFAAVLFKDRKVNENLIFICSSAVFVFLLGAIFLWPVFPTCFDEITGLTDFKVGSEYLICLISAVAAGILVKKRRRMDALFFRYVFFALVFTIFGELAFTLYVDVYGVANLLGHFFKITSFYLIYLAVIETGLLRPYRLLFRDLKRREETFEKMVDGRTRELSEANIRLKQEVEKRKQTEARLGAMEHKYRTIADQTYDWIYWEMPDGSLSYVSPSSLWITGYEAGAFIENPGLLTSIILPEDVDLFLETKRRVEKEGAARRIQFRIRKKDGDVRWIDHACKIIESDQKQYAGIRVSNRDVTDRRKALEALQESESKLSSIINNTDEMICSRDRDGALLVWNEAFAESIRKNFGVEPHVGLRTVDLLTPDQKAGIQEQIRLFKQVLTGETVKSDFSLQGPDGNTNYYEIAWSPMLSGSETIGAVETVRDVTEWKKLEAALLDSKQRYKTVADFTYAWEYWVGPDGNLLYISPSCKRLSGYTPEEFKENPDLLSDIVIPGDRNAWDAHRRDGFSDPGLKEIFFQIRRKDNDTRWIHHVCQPVYNETGRFSGIRASNRDITQLKLAEAKSRQHREELAHVLRTATLGELASSLAHELNQPLTSVLSNAQAALRYLDADNPDLDELRAIVEDIVSDDKRAGEIIRRLRGLMQRGDMEFKPLDVNRMIQEVLPLLYSDAVIRDITITIELAAGLPRVQGDFIQLQQVIMNLIRNASDAVQNLDKERRRVVISSKKKDTENILVEVKDFGKGLYAADVDKLFHPFYTTKPDGLGMGLSISRSICEAHGGRLWALPNGSRGATFVFSLPIKHETLSSVPVNPEST